MSNYTVYVEKFMNMKYTSLFSSPKPKAQVSFSDQNLSVVRRRRCRCCRCRRSNLVAFSSSSPEALGQFQPNLTQSILGWREWKFVQMKGPALFQGEIITKFAQMYSLIWTDFSAKRCDPLASCLPFILIHVLYIHTCLRKCGTQHIFIEKWHILLSFIFALLDRI